MGWSCQHPSVLASHECGKCICLIFRQHIMSLVFWTSPLGTGFLKSDLLSWNLLYFKNRKESFMWKHHLKGYRCKSQTCLADVKNNESVRNRHIFHQNNSNIGHVIRLQVSLFHFYQCKSLIWKLVPAEYSCSYLILCLFSLHSKDNCDIDIHPMTGLFGGQLLSSWKLLTSNIHLTGGK